MLYALFHNRFSENDRSGRTVACDVGGLRSDLVGHLRAHVLERLGKIDFFRYSHAVFGDLGRAERLLQENVSSCRSKCNFNRRGQFGYAFQHGDPGIGVKKHLLCCHYVVLLGLFCEKVTSR